MKLKFYYIVILCITLLGCGEHIYDENGNEIGDNPETAEYKWEAAWGDPEFISIVDDSLAVLAIYRRYFKEWKSCGLGCQILSETADRHVGLFLVNYREKLKPVWGDTLEYNLNIAKDYFKNSSVLVFDMKNSKFGFWKIGEKKVDFVNYDDYSGIKNREYLGYNARPFTDGNVFLFDITDSKSDPHKSKFLLEIENKQLKQIEFSGEYEWLSKCTSTKDTTGRYDGYGYYGSYNTYANISYIGSQLSCIRGNGKTDNFELTVNDIVMDTSSLNKSFIERIIGWYGNYVQDASNKIYKIDTLNFKFDSLYISIRFNDYQRPIFANAEGSGSVPVNYSTQDLLGVYD